MEYAVRDDGTMPAKRFLETLPGPDRAFFLVRFQRLADVGERMMNNSAVFKHERENIWCFRRTTKSSPEGGKGLIRFVCFRLANRWILTHGFWKPLNKSKWSEREFTLAFEIYNEVLKREKEQPQEKGVL